VIVEFAERLSGSYRDHAGLEHPLRMELQGRSRRGTRLRSFDVTGSLTARGLCERAPLSGEIRYAGPWSLEYDLELSDATGRRLRVRAAKRELGAALYAAFTTLRGAFVDPATSDEVASFAARFDARGDLRWWLENLKISRA
jgi:hypothetical protein